MNLSSHVSYPGRLQMLESETLSSTLDLLKVGIILTDEAARILHANFTGRAFLIDGSALTRSGAKLSARDRQSARELAQAIAVSATSTASDLPKFGIAVPIVAFDGDDLAAWVLPIIGSDGRDAARVAVFVRSLEDKSTFPAEMFRRRFGATRAECRVLILLSQGMTVKDAAQRLGVSLTTVKTHLGNLFAKTGTQRQIDLVRLATNAVAPASTC